MEFAELIWEFGLQIVLFKSWNVAYGVHIMDYAKNGPLVGHIDQSHKNLLTLRMSLLRKRVQ